MRHEIFGTRNRNDKKSIPECSPLKSPALNAVTKIMGKVGWGRNGFVGACDFKNPKNVSDRMLSASKLSGGFLGVVKVLECCYLVV